MAKAISIDKEYKNKPNSDAAGFPKPPPHLRMATKESEECDKCKFFNHGRCEKYSNLPVVSEWVCDSFKPWGAT